MTAAYHARAGRATGSAADFVGLWEGRRGARLAAFPWPGAGTKKGGRRSPAFLVFHRGSKAPALCLLKTGAAG